MKKQLYIAISAIVLFGAYSCRKDSEPTPVPITEAEPPKPVAPASVKYSVDTLTSVITWKGTKPTGSHTGTITLSNGNIFVKDSLAETGKFILNMTSITVTDSKTTGKDKVNLENHLKGIGSGNEDHFFNTVKFPTGNFEITAIIKGSVKDTIQGNLTLKGITKNIAFPATIAVNDSLVTLNSDNFKINRTLWNINYNSKSAIDNLGDKYIDDDIELNVKVVANKTKKQNIRRAKGRRLKS